MQCSEAHKAVKAVCIVGVIIAAHQEIQAAALRRWVYLRRPLSMMAGLAIFKAHMENDLGDTTALAKKLLLAGPITVYDNPNPPYGVIEEYTTTSLSSAGECMRCERLSRTEGEKEVIRCFMDVPRLSYDESVPISSSGFYLLQALHHKERNRRLAAVERARELAGLPRTGDGM